MFFLNEKWIKQMGKSGEGSCLGSDQIWGREGIKTSALYTLSLSFHVNIQVAMSRRQMKIQIITLAGVAQWIACWPGNQRVASLIPSQATCQVPSRGCVRGNHT